MANSALKSERTCKFIVVYLNLGSEEQAPQDLTALLSRTPELLSRKTEPFI